MEEIYCTQNGAQTVGPDPSPFHKPLCEREVWTSQWSHKKKDRYLPRGNIKVHI